jgi:hypothetical protein
VTFGDIVVLGVLGIVVGLIIAGMIRDKKKGKTCGGCSGCSGCSGLSGCSGCSSCTHCSGCPGKK